MLWKVLKVQYKKNTIIVMLDEYNNKIKKMLKITITTKDEFQYKNMYIWNS